VDPYYLTHKAEGIGYHPQVILSGRRINDNMGSFVASKVVKLLSQKGHSIKGAKVLLLGITFKENCPDIRNSRVINIVRELQDYGVHVHVYDPMAEPEEVQEEYGFRLVDESEIDRTYDGIVLAVGHSKFKTLNWQKIKGDHTIVYDVKSFLDKDMVSARL
jgi:UDP-N-acetyl-D-galactosamine dehydrogenase